MRQKIKEALRQEYKSRLELFDEELDGIAASIVTFIPDEAKMEEFVKSEATLELLKSFQRVLDKDRAKRNAKPEPPKPSDPANNPEPKPEPKAEPQDMAKIIADAVAAAIKPISDELAGFKAEQNAKSVLATAEATFKSNEYVKKYTDEASDAWERATEMYEAKGKSWTADELQTNAMKYFNKAVEKKGVDTTKPFPSDGGGGVKTDFSGLAKRLQEKGILPNEIKN